MRNNYYKIFLFAIALLFTTAVFSQNSSMHDFSKATIIIPENLSKQEQNAIKMLVEEIEKRTTIAIANRCSVCRPFNAGNCSINFSFI